MKFKKIEFARQTSFIIALLLIHFVFFGYLANVYPKAISDAENLILGEQILFLYQVLFNPQSFLSLIILVAIVFFTAFREKFFEYGIRNSIWLVPAIIIQSWIWYWFIIESFDITLIGTYFLRIESYITILTLLGINVSVAILAAIAREKFNLIRRRIKVVEV